MVSADSEPLELVVGADDVGRRLDQFVMSQLTGYGRRATAARMRSPRSSALRSPTPYTWRSASLVFGLDRAISRSVVS